MRASIFAVIAACCWALAAAAQQAAVELPPLVVAGMPERVAPFPIVIRRYHPPPLAAALREAPAAAASLPTFTGTSRQLPTGVYPYTMVGNTPFVTGTGTATVTAVIIPVVLDFEPQGIVFDPTQPDPVCSPDASAISLIQGSPVFGNYTVVAGPTTVGTGQIAALFQRANFWRWMRPLGIHNRFSLVLAPKLINPLHVKVTTGTVMASGGCGNVGMFPLSVWDDYVQNTAFKVMPLTLTPAVLPIFIFYNVLTTLDDGSCCFAGAHLAFGNPYHGGALQTYITSSFDSTGANPTNLDVLDLEHEVAEWQNDPYGGNTTPPWGNVGEVQGGCSTLMEAGDPLTGTSFTLSSPSGFTYHVQDLTFVSWYFGGVPSFGVNGWYSFFGSFNRPAAPCSAG